MIQQKSTTISFVAHMKSIETNQNYHIILFTYEFFISGTSFLKPKPCFITPNIILISFPFLSTKPNQFFNPKQPQYLKNYILPLLSYHLYCTVRYRKGTVININTLTDLRAYFTRPERFGYYEFNSLTTLKMDMPITSTPQTKKLSLFFGTFVPCRVPGPLGFFFILHHTFSYVGGQTSSKTLFLYPSQHFFHTSGPNVFLHTLNFPFPSVFFQTHLNFKHHIPKNNVKTLASSSYMRSQKLSIKHSGKGDISLTMLPSHCIIKEHNKGR